MIVLRVLLALAVPVAFLAFGLWLAKGDVRVQVYAAMGALMLFIVVVVALVDRMTK